MRKINRKVCKACGNKRALHPVRRRGRYIFSADHPLCQRCFRAEVDRYRAITKVTVYSFSITANNP